ncbi:MAG: LamG domain-containing protein [Fibrobacter sp.]|nr:LamG domain-containing protein [Fibrobacter sp.]
MKKFWLGVLALTSMWGCSTDSESVANSSETGDEVVAQVGGDAKEVETSVAQARVAMCAHNVRHGWAFEDTTAAFEPEEEISVIAENDSITEEGNFAVDATVAVDTAESFTIAAAGTDGDGDGWIVRAEKGDLEFHWRDYDKSEKWKKVSVGGELPFEEWTDVRVERVDSFVIIYVNGKAKGAFMIEGKLGDVHGNITVGHDKQEKDKCHCKGGRLEHVYVENVKEIEGFPEKKSESDTIKVEKIEPVVNDSAAEGAWIADWEFDDSANVGRDFSGNGHDAIIGEGEVTADSGIAYFNGKSGFYVNRQNDMNINTFVIEAKIKPMSYGSMNNIVVAEPPGRYGDGWMLRLDGETLRFHLRDSDMDGTDWQVFAGAPVALNEWTQIRVERSEKTLKVFQNGELTINEICEGNVDQQSYNWGIGYDDADQAFHTRYFDGYVDYIRFGSYAVDSSNVSGPSPTKKSPKLLAAWEFSDPTFVGLDSMSNNTSKIQVGHLTASEGVVNMDGESGLMVYLSKTFLRNEFAVEARVKPTAFGDMQNIIVAEPPGRYGDGWMVRIDNGVLRVHFRDEDTDGTEWQVFAGDTLALDEWTDIRMERTADSVKVFQNGKQTVAAAYAGDVSQLTYDIGLGYDAMYQAIHNRFFKGSIDYIRYYGL